MKNWQTKYINKIVCGDALKLLKEIPSETVTLTVTSPPYFQQREYENGGIGNEKSVEEYIDKLISILKEIVRITKNNGSIVFNLGDKYDDDGGLLLVPYKFAQEAINKCNLKLINSLLWIKPNPTPRQFKKRLVNAYEPFFIFVKSRDYIFNLDEFNKTKKRANINRRHTRIGEKYFELIDKSDLKEEEKKQAKLELIKAIEQVKTGEIYSFRMKIRGIHALPFGGQNGGRLYHIKNKGFTIIKIHGNSLKPDYMINSVATIKGAKHPAIFPLDLVKEIVKLLSNRGDIVLDPFVGSGTTAIAALQLDRKFIGIDIRKKYCEYAKERIKNLHYQKTLL
ncbi:site-specific DNA-methyltransferase [bacterium]|nr:site-specific DNA-methyltransferase [bacterium]